MECIHSTEFAFCLFVNICGMLFTVTSCFCMWINTNIDKALREIFISFSIANFVGESIMIYDMTVSACYESNFTSIPPLIRVSILLTMTHQLLLMLAEFAILTTAKGTVRRFTGLIILAWLLSITTGILISKKSEAKVHSFYRLPFVLLMSILCIVTCVMFLPVILKYQTLRRFEQYKIDFLNQDPSRRNRNTSGRQCEVKLKVIAVIVVSYLICSVLWIFNEIYIDQHMKLPFKQSDYLALMIYSLNFYSISSACIYLWHEKHRVRIQPQPREQGLS